MTAVTTATSPPPVLGGPIWNTYRPGDSRSAKRFVHDAAVLLHAVAARTGASNDRHLVDQLSRTLGLGKRESTLPQESLAAQNPELSAQAVRVGEDITQWARQALADHRKTGPAPASRRLEVRSRCDGHVWTHEVAALLTGPQGSPAAMQLFNEWLHQMVLLRDALLPFANWKDVPLPVRPDGLRRLDRARESFLTELTTRRARHTAIVAFARTAAAGADGPDGPDGYGFTTPRGTALPHAATRPDGPASRLLHWAPAQGPQSTATFVSTIDDYYAADRSDAPAVAGAPAREDAARAPVTGRLLLSEATDGVRTAVIEVTQGHESAQVDLGQALRGHRHAYRTTGRTAAAGGRAATARELDAWRVLAAPGLVWSAEGEYFVAAPQGGLMGLALLGKLYPENVCIVKAGADAPEGKAGPARFEVRTA